MKTIVFLALLLPLTVLAQSKADYEHAMKRFQRLYNAGKGDSIGTLFTHPPDTTFWNDEWNIGALKQYGTLQSFTYLGVDKTDIDSVRVFRTVFSKAGAKTTSMTLHTHQQFGTFRFLTTSEGIDDLLKKRKRSQ